MQGDSPYERASAASVYAYANSVAAPTPVHSGAGSWEQLGSSQGRDEVYHNDPWMHQAQFTPQRGQPTACWGGAGAQQHQQQHQQQFQQVPYRMHPGEVPHAGTPGWPSAAQMAPGGSSSGQAWQYGQGLPQPGVGWQPPAVQAPLVPPQPGPGTWLWQPGGGSAQPSTVGVPGPWVLRACRVVDRGARRCRGWNRNLWVAVPAVQFTKACR